MSIELVDRWFVTRFLDGEINVCVETSGGELAWIPFDKLVETVNDFKEQGS